MAIIPPSHDCIRGAGSEGLVFRPALSDLSFPLAAPDRSTLSCRRWLALLPLPLLTLRQLLRLLFITFRRGANLHHGADAHDYHTAVWPWRQIEFWNLFLSALEWIPSLAIELVIMDGSDTSWWKVEQSSILFLVPLAYLEVVAG